MLWEASVCNQGIDGVMQIWSLVSWILVYCGVEYIGVLKASLEMNNA